MDCREFHRLLPRYLRGELAPEVFARMVEHEAACTACHTLAAERMTDPAQAQGDAAWLAGTLERTLGRHCAFIEERLAEALDGRLERATEKLVERHLATCPACRALAQTLGELPAYYAAVPRLRADASFLRGVLDRTVGPRAGFLEVVRHLWRKGDLIWEAAVLATLLLAPLIGRPLVDWVDRIQSSPEIARAGMRLQTVETLPLQTVREQWQRLETFAEETLDRVAPADPTTGSRFAPLPPWARAALAGLGVGEAPGAALATGAETDTLQTEEPPLPEGGQHELREP